eukprot:802200-Pleurochrysis_carterae.AAC.1
MPEYTSARAHARLRVCARGCVHCARLEVRRLRACACARVRERGCAYVRVRACARIHTCARALVWVNVHEGMYTRAHVAACARTHACVCSRARALESPCFASLRTGWARPFMCLLIWCHRPVTGRATNCEAAGQRS